MRFKPRRTVAWPAMLRMCTASCLALSVLIAKDAAAIGFEEVQVPEPGGRLLSGAFWYPSNAPAQPMTLGFLHQTVAAGAHVTGANLPLVVISHGAMGSWQGHADLAAALANAGFVVAALTHDEFGPNWTLKPADRTVQLRGLIDYALHGWPEHAHLDASRIGAFGFSLGGFTVLVAAGGRPNTAVVKAHCDAAPVEWSCVMQADRHLDFVQNPPPASAWVADPRIKATVIIAPAMGYLFGTAGLAPVRIPIQLWQGENDSILKYPWNAEVVRRDLPTPPEYHLVAGADHGDFAGACDRNAKAGTGAACRSATGFDRGELHRNLDNSVVAFFIRTLVAPR